MSAPEPTIVDTVALKRRPLPAHPAELYTVATFAEPIAVGAAMSDAALARYRQHGWLAVEDVWDESTVAASARLLDELAGGRESAATERQLEATAGDPSAAARQASPQGSQAGIFSDARI